MYILTVFFFLNLILHLLLYFFDVLIAQTFPKIVDEAVPVPVVCVC
jgi:hypothetical protein